jgi:hypothetical protein
MEKPYEWKVVPIYERQMRDIRTADLLRDGDMRKCDTYRGGGGYDQFPAICEKRLGRRLHHQLVVQLACCPLRCHYCYVTVDGVFGKPKPYTSRELVECFVESGQEIFHLMGGAPAIYLEHWPELIGELPKDAVFHSDFLLIERPYKKEWLQAINQPNCLYAVSVKGADAADFKANTGVELDDDLFWENLDALVRNGVNFYLTFTNCDQAKLPALKAEIASRFGPQVLDDSFEIGLIEYDALK